MNLFVRLPIFISCMLCVTMLCATPSRQLAEAYIAQYKGIAVSEMQRSGIPASIKLAQGLLESNWGRSELAQEANNHFGIKCGGTWSGGTFHQEDDDRDENGELIASCFRAYPDGYESYIAHTDFLLDPNKNYRYGFLFELETTDYRRWARGLREAGYATDERYPQKLIQIIEQYKLYEYDQPVDASDRIYVAKNIPIEEKKDNASHRRGEYHYDYINGVKMTKAKGGESVIELSKRLKVTWSQLIRNNEGLTDERQILKEGEYVYVERKPKAVKKGPKTHKVSDGEGMYDIAQTYGVDMKSLYRMNKISSDDELSVGMELSLDQMIKKDAKRNDVASSKKSHNVKSGSHSRKKSKQKVSNNSEYLFDENWADKGRGK